MSTTSNPALGNASALPRAEFIERSHQRSAGLGLSRAEKREVEPMVRSDLTLARERNQRLYLHAAPVMHMLFEQIINTESMIVMTDAAGTILHSVGDDDFLARADKVALAPGANWAEHSRGTNAIGTALFEGSPTLIHGPEHFMHANNFLTCSAAPIFDPRGNMLGVLDVTGDHRSYHQHTMGLVRMSARMIENHWLSDDYNNRLRLHFHSRAEFIGTLLEGILVVGPDGKLLGANRGALDQLGLSGAALRAQTLTSLLGTTTAAIYDHFRMPLSAPMRLSLVNGQSFYVSARFDWPSRPVVAGLGLLKPDQQEAGAFDGAAAGGLNSDSGPVRSWLPGAEACEPGSVEQGVGMERSARKLGAPPALAAQPGEPGHKLSGLQYLRTGDAQVDTLVQKIQRILDRDIPLLILGETGTGKELLARAVHVDSKRARQPFVAVNCASIPESLIEAELFGYEDGAFTGARRKGATGRIVQANGGTLFLDEIGDMPLPLQARLLRVLQERSVTPLGSNKSIPVDIAVFCATHRNLREMIAAQSFREDLYYRLNGLAVRIPALRERSDLDVIVRRILLAERPHDVPSLSPQVAELFMAYHWPGNIRQLSNVLRTAAVMSAGEAQITSAHLSDDFLEDAGAQQSQRASPAAPQREVIEKLSEATSPQGLPAQACSGFAGQVGALDPLLAQQQAEVAMRASLSPLSSMSSMSSLGHEASLGHTLEQAEIEMIRAALAAAGGNISAASKKLGISRNTIYRKLHWNNTPAVTKSS
ncbi:sigma-54-dependent Fis family transcriptional regulator [Paucibacter sp. KBW04]|uniref:sigma-54-dependent Fis family transcriptional regulator n=1 Tax=Paucibacter sp. KBW04 TaxID=2153361 RepID=UPI000F568104|nr:sigma-54-dependent Fis family transcriptional regulator [Paucibacter sp. KBW04]RQO63485.1 sigma-54-dependent Fis family transcriptional regulator [Paucibacter sp. KBW04]